MLSVLELLRQDDQFEFSAIAPEVGELAERLARLKIRHVPFSVRPHGVKQPTAVLHSQLQQIVTQTAPDILHSNSLSMSRLTGQIDFDARPSLVRTGHLRDIIKLSAKVIADLNANDALVAVSCATRDYHTNQGLDSERCSIVHNGVDTQIFQPQNTTSLRQRLLPQIPDDAKIVMNVGQICLRKNQLELARAVCRLLETRDDLHLVIVGERHSTKAESIAFENAIAAEFAAARKSARLHQLGYRDDVHLLLNAASILAHVAHQEPLGRTLLEAAACGLPIIATNVGGTSEILRHNQDALLIDATDQHQIAAAIDQLIDDEPRQQTLGKSGRQRVLDHFNVERAAEQLKQFWIQKISLTCDRAGHT